MSNNNMANNKELEFDSELITKYPKSNKKIALEVEPYGLDESGKDEGVRQPPNAQCVHISPYGLEFQAQEDYPSGTLLRILVNLPNYWTRKQQLVEYRRIDKPEKFKILAKVVKTEDVGKRGKKKRVTVQTVNMDEIDEQVLKSFLQE